MLNVNRMLKHRNNAKNICRVSNSKQYKTDCGFDKQVECLIIIILSSTNQSVDICHFMWQLDRAILKHRIIFR